MCCFVFFFKQKTAYEIYQCDWSSDVCSSDLVRIPGPAVDDQSFPGVAQFETQRARMGVSVGAG